MKYLYLFLALLCVLQGQAQLKSYHYRQELQGVQPNHWHQLSLPSTVFQHLESGYDDLRIYGVSATDTIEVPYSIDKTNYIDTESRTSYTDSVAQKLSVPFNVQQLKKEKQTLISIALPHTLRLSKIAFTINANYDYFRKVKVLKRYTASQESDPYNEDSTLLFSDVLSSKTPNAFYFRTRLIKYIQIIIDNADNQPLPIGEIVVSAVPYTPSRRALVVPTIPIIWRTANGATTLLCTTSPIFLKIFLPALLVSLLAKSPTSSLLLQPLIRLPLLLKRRTTNSCFGG